MCGVGGSGTVVGVAIQTTVPVTVQWTKPTLAFLYTMTHPDPLPQPNDDTAPTNALETWLHNATVPDPDDGYPWSAQKFKNNLIRKVYKVDGVAKAGAPQTDVRVPMPGLEATDRRTRIGRTDIKVRLYVHCRFNAFGSELSRRTPPTKRTAGDTGQTGVPAYVDEGFEDRD